ncbi:polysaccharide pyruvyl transferase family protein [Paenibacillus sp. strain BS8-2]
MNNKVVILGWYGTETLGDKAILAGILGNVLKNGVLLEDITLLSLNVDYTRLTIIDLGYQGLKVLDFYSMKQDMIFIQNNDVFIMGGGPLCDIDEMIYVLEIFHNAKRLGKKTILYSCGVGPLNVDKYSYVFSEILLHSDEIQFRDYYTPEKYRSLIGDHQYSVAIDPAFNYLYSVKSNIGDALIGSPYVMFCLRKWPRMYSFGINDNEYEEIVEYFEKFIFDTIKDYKELGVKVILFPMHNYYIGNDDREYFLELCEKYELWNDVQIIGHEYSINEAVNYFKYADKVFAMRFHSVVFAIALETDFIALDYQIDDGKITGVLNMLDLSRKVLRIGDFKKNIDKIKAETTGKHDVNWNNVNNIISTQIAKLI